MATGSCSATLPSYLHTHTPPPPVQVHAVEDNLLSRPADPVFLGCCAAVGLDAGAKAAEPEALMPVYEAYAPLVATRPMAQAFGRLVPALGVYYFSVAHVREIESLLAREPLTGVRLAPVGGLTQRGAAAKVAGYALQRVLSDWVATDAVAGAARGVVFVDVGEEFAPVWGAPPFFVPDSPAAAVEQLLLLHSGCARGRGRGAGVGCGALKQRTRVPMHVCMSKEAQARLVSHAQLHAQLLCCSVAGVAGSGWSWLSSVGMLTYMFSRPCSMHDRFLCLICALQVGGGGGRGAGRQ